MLLASKTFTLNLDKSDTQNTQDNIVKYFRLKSSPAHFLPALELSANLMQVTPRHFKLTFSMEKLIKLR